jgi:hypothetical protein
VLFVVLLVLETRLVETSLKIAATLNIVDGLALEEKNDKLLIFINS